MYRSKIIKMEREKGIISIISRKDLKQFGEKKGNKHYFAEWPIRILAITFNLIVNLSYLQEYTEYTKEYTVKTKPSLIFEFLKY